MADFLYFINPSVGIKTSSVTINGLSSNSQTYRSDTVVSVSGLNSIYDDRFKLPVDNADTLDGHSEAYYLDRVNHSGTYSYIAGTDYSNGFQSGSYTINWASYNLQSISLSGDISLTFSGALQGSRLQLSIAQDNVGSRIVSWPSDVKWAGGVAPTLTTNQSGLDILAFYKGSSSYYGTYALDFT